MVNIANNKYVTNVCGVCLRYIQLIINTSMLFSELLTESLYIKEIFVRNMLLIHTSVWTRFRRLGLTQSADEEEDTLQADEMKRKTVWRTNEVWNKAREMAGWLCDGTNELLRRKVIGRFQPRCSVCWCRSLISWQQMDGISERTEMKSMSGGG